MQYFMYYRFSKVEEDTLAKLIVVANPKGGCGKSTTVLNVASGLGKAGYRVAVVDADSQESLSECYDAQDLANPFPFSVVSSNVVQTPYKLLGMPYDIILVDTPSGLLKRPDAQFARDSVALANRIIVPFAPASMDFRGAVPFVKFLAESRNHPPCGVLINRRQNNRIGQQAQGKAAELFHIVPNATVFETTIGQRTPITEGVASGRTIFDYAPSHLAAHEYHALTREIILWLSKQG